MVAILARIGWSCARFPVCWMSTRSMWGWSSAHPVLLVSKAKAAAKAAVGRRSRGSSFGDVPASVGVSGPGGRRREWVVLALRLVPPCTVFVLMALGAWSDSSVVSHVFLMWRPVLAHLPCSFATCWLLRLSARTLRACEPSRLPWASGASLYGLPPRWRGMPCCHAEDGALRFSPPIYFAGRSPLGSGTGVSRVLLARWLPRLDRAHLAMSSITVGE